VGDDLVRPASWDGLRVATRGPFALPTTREEFVDAAQARPELEARARAIGAWLDSEDVRVLASYGVGAAALEWHLHNLRPSRELIVTDYGEKTVERLAEIFPEARATVRDILDGPLASDMHLFHRVDTELDDQAWRRVFGRFATARILVVATEILGPKQLVGEILNHALHPHAARAGFVRTRSAFESLWRDTHDAQALRVHDLHGWALSPKATQARPLL
jgi:hypothetical protein